MEFKHKILFLSYKSSKAGNYDLNIFFIISVFCIPLQVPVFICVFHSPVQNTTVFIVTLYLCVCVIFFTFKGTTHTVLQVSQNYPPQKKKKKKCTSTYSYNKGAHSARDDIH